MSKQMRCQGCRKQGGWGGGGVRPPSQFLSKQLTLSQSGGRLYPSQYYEPSGLSYLATALGAVRIRRQKNDVAIFSLSLLLQCTVCRFIFCVISSLVTRIITYQECQKGMIGGITEIIYYRYFFTCCTYQEKMAPFKNSNSFWLSYFRP